MHPIIVVEDDGAIAKLIVINLRKAGYGLVEEPYATLEDATERLEAFRANPFALAIVDMVLRNPNGSLDVEGGLAFCEALRANESAKHIPIITSSAYADTEQVARLRQLSNHHLIKPLKVRELVDTVARLLSGTDKGDTV